MVWLPLYHNYFIAKAKHFPFPVLTILPSDSIYFHKPSAILIWQSPFKLDHISGLVTVPQNVIYT